MRTRVEIEDVRRQVASPHVFKLSRLFRALGDENRLTILRVLISRHNLCVSELAKLLKVSIPAVSQHLRLLQAAGAVQRVRHGQSVCFELVQDKAVFSAIQKVIRDFS